MTNGTKKPGEEGQLDAELDSIAELLDGDFGEALGDLLGAPPPLPPPPDDQVMTSAARPAHRSGPIPAPAAAATAPPTDEEVFGGDDASDSIDAAFARATGESDPDQPFAEKTRIASVDDGLLRQARRQVGDQPSPARQPARRGPAIVRRDQLTRPPIDEHDESTRIADAGFQMAAAAELVSEETPAAGVELDESFYDGIEIGASTGEEPARDSRPAAPGTRRVTRNVVRRAETSRGSTPPVAAASRPPAAGEPTAATAAETDLLTTGVYGKKDKDKDKERDPGRISAPSAAVADLAAEIDEIVSSDPSGSSPLIDVLADFRRAESSHVTGPISEDLSIDLEGSLESLEDAGYPEEVEIIASAPSEDEVEDEVDEPDGGPEEVEIIASSAEEDEGAAIGQEAEAEPPPADEPEDDDLSIEVSRDESPGDATLLDDAPPPPAEQAPPPPRVVDYSVDLAIEPARLALPVRDPQEVDVEPDLIVELTEIEQEIERALALPPDKARSARLHLRAGATAERLGDTDRAREHYDEACHADEDLLPAWRAARRLLFRRGEIQEGLRHLDRELELGSPAERAALAAHRADLLLAVGEQDLARVAYGELIDARPDDLRSLLAELELAFADDREDELLLVLAAAAAQVRDPELASALHLLSARLHERAGRLDEASGAFEAALAAAPGDRLARWGLLRLSLRAGRPADASHHAETLLSGTSDALLIAAAARRRAVAALAADDVEAATRALVPAAGSADPLVLELAAETHERAGRVAEVAQALRAWADVEPAAARRAEVLHRLAALEEGADALRSFARAAEADPGDMDTLAELAALRVAAGEVDAAVSLERTAAAAEPGAAAGAHLRAARLLSSVGRHDEAVSELRAAILAEPGTPIVIDALARGLELAGRSAELVDHLRDTAELGPGGPAVARERAARAGEAVAGARDPAADEGWRALRAIEPGAWVAHAALERLATARDDRAALADVLAAQLAAVRDPLRQSIIAARRAAVLGALGDDAEARNTLEDVLASDRSDARAADRLALAAARAGLPGDAAAALAARAEATADSPERDALRYRAAVIFEAEGDTSRAADLLAPTLASQPAFGGAAVLQERLYRRLGDTEALTALLERELRAGGESARPARLVRLAELIADSGADAARAASLFREVLGQRPDDPIVRDGFRRVAIAAREVAPLADLALADLNRAEERGDVAGKVAAYEELARIDGDLRGDVASATLGWQAAVDLDPAHLPALRALERTYLAVPENAAEKRVAELGAIYDKLGAALAHSPNDAVPVILERARLHERQGQIPAAIGDHREALALTRPRMSLFRLEMRAREAGALEEMAGLAESIADYFAVDARGRAAFLVRAGEALADAGRAEEAIARFHAAADTLPGFVPALRAWRRVALTSERWADVVSACEREAQVARVEDERIALLHLAGVTAMDRGGDMERAARALRHVLVIEPRHQDAFKRLRKLFAGPEHKAELAELLTARVDVEGHPGRLVELHQTLAQLYRESLNDPERAKVHLRAVLGRDPRNLPAVTALSEVAWVQGQWSEAAEALIQRAKLEKSPETLKEIFFRLGVIYAEKLPDRKWAVKSFERVLMHDPNDIAALEHLSALSVEAGEWRMALGATERLIGLDTEPTSKVKHLLRVSHIHEEGNGDRKRAEEALRRALDAEPASTDALAALIGFYNRGRDTASLRVNLDRVAAGMRARLAKDPFDGVAYRLLARALEARAEAGVAGSLEAARCAAELAEALGSGDEVDRELALQTRQARPSIKGLGLLHIDELLFHPSIPNGFRQLFRLLYDTLGKRFPPDLRRAGVGKGDRLPRTGHPVREILARVAAELGLGDFDVYVSTARPAAFTVELTDPISIILGSAVATAGEAQLRFAGARTMKLATSYMAVPSSLGPEELGVLLSAVIRQHDPGFTPAGVNVAAIGEETQRLARLIPKRMRDEIMRFATEISGHALDHHALWLGVQHTGNRAGLVAAGSVRAGLDVLLRAGNHRELVAARGDAQIEELVRFAVSNEHCEVRAALAV